LRRLRSIRRAIRIWRKRRRHGSGDNSPAHDGVISSRKLWRCQRGNRSA
jgi:hypothetical protein